MAVVTLDIDQAGLTAMQQLCNPKQFRKDVKAGLKYAVPTVRKVVAREIGTHYAIPAARIKQDIKNLRYDDNGIKVTFNRNPPTLRAYGGKPIGTVKKGLNLGRPVGVKYKIFKGEQEKARNVFWLNVGGVGRPGIPFIRFGPASTQIRALRGPSIGSIFVGKSKWGEQMRAATTEAAQIQFIKGVERSMSRRVRGF